MRSSSSEENGYFIVVANKGWKLFEVPYTNFNFESILKNLTEQLPRINWVYGESPILRIRQIHFRKPDGQKLAVFSMDELSRSFAFRNEVRKAFGYDIDLTVMVLSMAASNQLVGTELVLP